jgi:Asp/Glu/hydantoin racemase
LAQMMGRHFATIVSDIPSIDQEEAKIDSLDARKFAITHHPVRCLKMDEERFFNCLMEGDYDQVIRAFYEVAQNCIEDGADVLISGCGLFSPMLTTKNIRQVEGVPIIDPMQTALKFAEMMVDFKAAGMPVISRKGIYLKASREEIEKGCHQLGLS